MPTNTNTPPSSLRTTIKYEENKLTTEYDNNKTPDGSSEQTTKTMNNFLSAGIGIAAVVLVIIASLVLLKYRRRNSYNKEKVNGGGVLDSVAITPTPVKKAFKPKEQPSFIADNVEEENICGGCGVLDFL